MAPRTRLEELHAAWRALRSETPDAGWRTIQIEAGGTCLVLAGRQFPGNEEALIVGFSCISRPVPDSLPQGQGFLVTTPDLGAVGAGHTWVALARKAGAAYDLFAVMADDVLDAVHAPYLHDDQSRFSVFLERIRAWQEFMRRNVSLLLSPEEEIGLVGELEILTLLVESGYPSVKATEAWQGPRNGLHDFVINAGAIEVKTTTATGSFPADIASLAQLDDSIVNPLFVGAVQLLFIASGTTLPERIDGLRSRLRSDPAARAILESRLVQAGYFESMREHYVRRFVTKNVDLIQVTEDFPRLTSLTVPREVRKARYEIDLSMVTQPAITIAEALRALGVAN